MVPAGSLAGLYGPEPGRTRPFLRPAHSLRDSALCFLILIVVTIVIGSMLTLFFCVLTDLTRISDEDYYEDTEAVELTPFDSPESVNHQQGSQQSVIGTRVIEIDWNYPARKGTMGLEPVAGPGDGNKPKSSTDSWSSSSSSSSSSSEIGEEIEISESFQSDKKPDDAPLEPPAPPPPPTAAGTDETAASGAEIEEEIEEEPMSSMGADDGMAPMPGNELPNPQMGEYDDAPTFGSLGPTDGPPEPYEPPESMQASPGTAMSPPPDGMMSMEEDPGTTGATGPAFPSSPPADRGISDTPAPGMDTAVGATPSATSWSEEAVNQPTGVPPPSDEPMPEGGEMGSELQAQQMTSMEPPSGATNGLAAEDPGMGMSPMVPEQGEGAQPQALGAMNSFPLENSALEEGAGSAIQTPMAATDTAISLAAPEPNDTGQIGTFNAMGAPAAGIQQISSTSDETSETSTDDELVKNMFPVKSNPLAESSDPTSSSKTASASSTTPSSGDENSEQTIGESPPSQPDLQGTAAVDGGPAPGQGDIASAPEQPSGALQYPPSDPSLRQQDAGSVQAEQGVEQPQSAPPAENGPPDGGASPADAVPQPSTGEESMFAELSGAPFGADTSASPEFGSQPSVETDPGNAPPPEGDSSSPFGGTGPQEPPPQEVSPEATSQPQAEGAQSSEPPGGEGDFSIAATMFGEQFEPPSLFDTDTSVPGTASQTAPQPSQHSLSSASQTAPDSGPQMQTTASQAGTQLSNHVMSSASQTGAPESSQLQTTGSQTGFAGGSDRRLTTSASQTGAPQSSQLQTTGSQTVFSGGSDGRLTTSASQTGAPKSSQLQTTGSQTGFAGGSDGRLTTSASQTGAPGSRSSLTRASQTAPPSGAGSSSSVRNTGSQTQHTRPASSDRDSSAPAAAPEDTQHGLRRDTPSQRAAASPRSSQPSAQRLPPSSSGASPEQQTTLAGLLAGSQLAALAREGIDHLTAGEDTTFGSPDFPAVPSQGQLAQIARDGINTIVSGRDTTFGSPQFDLIPRQDSQTEGFEPPSDAERHQSSRSVPQRQSVSRQSASRQSASRQSASRQSSSRQSVGRQSPSASLSQQGRTASRRSSVQESSGSRRSSLQEPSGSRRPSQVGSQRRVSYSESRPTTGSALSTRTSQPSSSRSIQPDLRQTSRTGSRRPSQPDSRRPSQASSSRVSPRPTDSGRQNQPPKSSLQQPSQTEGSGRRPSQTEGSVRRPSQTEGSGRRPSQTEGSGRRPSQTEGSGRRPSQTEGSVRRPSQTEGSGRRPCRRDSRRRQSQPDARRRPSQSPPQLRPPHSDSDLLRTESSDQPADDKDSVPGPASEFQSYECLESRLRLCDGRVPYKRTAPPNFAGATSEEQIIDGLPYYEVISDSGCSPLVAEYICSSIEPQCVADPVPRALPPCRDFCREIVESCAQTLIPGMRENQAFNCSQLPQSRDPAVCYTSTADRCVAGEFACADRAACVPASWRCDGTPQCDDASDELQCDTCTPKQFRCRSDGGCVAPQRVCDGFADCAEGEDELDCAAQGAEFASAIASKEDTR